MKDRSDDPSQHERTLLPRSYISLPKWNKVRKRRETESMIFLNFITTQQTSGACVRNLRPEMPRLGMKSESSADHYWIDFFIHVHAFSTSIQAMRARCCSVVRAFAHGAMGRRIDPSWGGTIELFLVPASAPRLV